MNDALRLDDAPGIGHNAPPAEDAFPTIKTRTEILAATANQWLAKVHEITDAETAGACDSFLSQVRAERQAADAYRKEINKPAELVISDNNNRFRPIIAVLAKCEDLLKPMKARWLINEGLRIVAERKAAEALAYAKMQAADDARAALAKSVTVEAEIAVDEADAATAEAIKALAAADAAKPTIKGDLSPRASGLRQYWFAEIRDYDAALRYYSGDAKLREIVQSLANADARAHKIDMKVPGCTARMEERV